MCLRKRMVTSRTWSPRWWAGSSLLLPAADHGGELVDGDAELAGLGHQGADVLVGELAAPALEQLFAGAGGDEHPDSSSLRSEERRVGKACRSRGSPYHLK